MIYEIILVVIPIGQRLIQIDIYFYRYNKETKKIIH